MRYPTSRYISNLNGDHFQILYSVMFIPMMCSWPHRALTKIQSQSEMDVKSGKPHVSCFDLHSLQLKWSPRIGHPKRKLIFQPLIFRGELFVSGRVFFINKNTLKAKLSFGVHREWGGFRCSEFVTMTKRISCENSSRTLGCSPSH